MSEKYLPIKIFEKRKDYDDRSTEGGGDSHEGSWVLHGEELNKRADYLNKNVNTIQDSFQKWKENKRALPMIISTTVIDKAIAKTHRGRIVNLLENDGKDSSLNVWSEQGVMYWYLQALFSFALSTSVIIFIDIVLYVISDLKRYNTLDQNYKQYDQESDNRYMYLLSDFRIYTIMIIFVFILSIPLSAIYGEESQKWSGILVSCLCAVVGIVLVVQWVKHKSKEEIKRILLKVGGKIAEWMFVALLCFTISAIFIVNNKATISVSYNADGIVEICNTSAENYNGLDIEIWNMDGEKIYTESVEKEKLLFAREGKYVNNEVEGEKVAEGILINSECLHWKYMFDLKEVINESGEYCVSITVHQDGKSAFLINSLSVENKEYIFAKDSMEKDY